MQKFRNQGPNPCHSSDPSHRSDNARSLMYDATGELPKTMVFLKKRSLVKHQHGFLAQFHLERFQICNVLSVNKYIYACILLELYFLMYFRVSSKSFFFFFFWLFRATPMAYGSSQTRGRTGAAAASHSHGHSNTGSERSLQPTPQLTATLDP